MLQKIAEKGDEVFYWLLTVKKYNDTEPKEAVNTILKKGQRLQNFKRIKRSLNKVDCRRLNCSSLAAGGQ
jgi:hypothetical protein